MKGFSIKAQETFQPPNHTTSRHSRLWCSTNPPPVPRGSTEARSLSFPSPLSRRGRNGGLGALREQGPDATLTGRGRRWGNDRTSSPRYSFCTTAEPICIPCRITFLNRTEIAWELLCTPEGLLPQRESSMDRHLISASGSDPSLRAAGAPFGLRTDSRKPRNMESSRKIQYSLC